MILTVTHGNYITECIKVSNDAHKSVNRALVSLFLFIFPLESTYAGLRITFC